MTSEARELLPCPLCNVEVGRILGVRPARMGHPHGHCELSGQQFSLRFWALASRPTLSPQDEERAEIERLTALLSQAREDALEEAAKVAEKPFDWRVGEAPRTYRALAKWIASDIRSLSGKGR